MLSNKLVLTLLLLLVLPLVSGENFDVGVIGDSVAEVCGGETILFTAKVTNYDVANSFTVNLRNSASSFSTVVPSSFILEQGKSKLIYIYITPSSKVLAGKYNLDLLISSKENVKKLFYEINVGSCHGVEMSGLGNKEICSCTNNKYDITIKNLGKYDEVYDIVVEGNAKDFVSLSQSSLSLLKGEVKVINAFLDVPCDITGDYTFSVKLMARTSSTIAYLDFPLKIFNCFNFFFSTDKDYVSMCEHSTENIILSIENKGVSSNIFGISLEGPEWVYLENSVVSLDINELKKIDLVLNPDYGVKGNFDIKVMVGSDKGGTKQEKDLQVNVNECHSVSLDIIKEKGRICGSLTGLYEVVVSNNGAFEKNYKLGVEGADWVSLSKDNIKLGPGGGESVFLEVKPGKDVPAGKYNIKIGALSLDESGVRAEDNIEIEVIKSEECYKVSISADNIDVKVDNSATLPVIIENRGDVKAEYVIELSGTASGFVQINPGTVEIEPGKSEIVYMYIAPSLNLEEGDYNALISARVENENVLATKEIKINVESRLSEIKEEYEKESFWFKLKNLFKSNITGNVVKENISEDVNISEETQGSGLEISSYRYILIGLVVLIILVLFFRSKGKSVEDELEELTKGEAMEDNEKEESSEELKENENGGRVWPYIFGLILIAILIGLVWKFFNFIDLYKYYLLGGLVILLVLVLVIRYWKNITKFFEKELEEEKIEEEEKEPEEKPKKKGRPKKK